MHSAQGGNLCHLCNHLTPNPNVDREFVALPQGYSNTALQNVTLTAWVRTTESGGTLSSNWSILDFDNANYYAFYVRGSDGKVGFSFYNSNGTSGAVRHLSSNTAVNDGHWHHIAVVFGDKTNANNYTDVKFYVDGQLDNHTYNSSWGPNIGRPNTTRYGFIGDGSKATSPYNLGMRYKKYYSGSIDELAYWHGSLSAAQVQAIYNNGVQAVSSTNLQAWYSFDGQTTATITDNSGNGNHGTAFKNGNTTNPAQFTPGTTQRITATTAIANVRSYTDYYPFGSPMPGRSFNLGNYEYGFNGKRFDSEWHGSPGTIYDYGFRIYDARIARFLSVDPLTASYPWYTPYQFAGNNPIRNLDLDGLEELDYTSYQQGMINGVTQLRLIPFPTVDPSIWQDPIVYKDNPYWKPAKRTRGVHPSTLQMQSGKLPSDAINYIYNNPDKHTMECGQFVQTVKLYGMLQSMGADAFNEYMATQGDNFYLKNHGSTGVNYQQIYSKELGIWNADINENKVIKNAEIGTEITLRTDALEGTVFYNENIVKVGKNQYLAQGITGDNPMSLKDIKKALAEMGGVKAKDVYVKEIKISSADVSQ